MGGFPGAAWRRKNICIPIHCQYRRMQKKGIILRQLQTDLTVDAEAFTILQRKLLIATLFFEQIFFGNRNCKQRLFFNDIIAAQTLHAGIAVVDPNGDAGDLDAKHSSSTTPYATFHD